MFIDRLVERLERCSGDGTACENCPVLAACLKCWDKICEQTITDEYQYLELAAVLDSLRDAKRQVVTVFSNICRD